jgi:cytidylate kinase
MIRIAIDGPGGAGKSSLAKAVAEKLEIIYVDTGALYRTIGYYMLNHGINPTDATSVAAALGSFTLELTYVNGEQVILLDGENVKDAIRTPEMSMAASNVSAIKEVREFLLNTQREIAKPHSVIMDGRDIGTVILPDAEVKIFLTASPEARARRRYEELKAKGKEVSYEQVYTEMVERDKNDSTRDIAPCVPADDAIMLDNSDMTAEQTTEAVIKIIKKAQKKQKKNFYMKAHKIFAAPIRFFSGTKTYGKENIPKEGGFLLCANHIAVRDVLLIGATCPRQIKFVAKKELFSIPILSSIIKALGAVKLDRGGNDVAAIRKSIEVVENGDIVSIFPQGHRYPAVDPSKTPIKSGAGMVAYRSGCDVIPVFIKTKGNKYGIFKKTEIIYGKPIKNSDFGFVNGGSDEYKSATSIIFNQILKLGGYSHIPPEENKIEN